MSEDEPEDQWSVVTVYRDRESAERATHELVQAGFDMRDLSIVGRDVQLSEQPGGFVTTSDFAAAGAGIGACLGSVFGIGAGMAVLIVPGLGPVVVAGPIAAAVAGAAEGSAAGAGLGALAGALVGWEVLKGHASHCETDAKEEKFLVLARGGSQKIQHAQSILGSEGPEHLEDYETPVSLTTGGGT